VLEDADFVSRVFAPGDDRSGGDRGIESHWCLNQLTKTANSLGEAPPALDQLCHKIEAIVMKAIDLDAHGKPAHRQSAPGWKIMAWTAMNQSMLKATAGT
jgi:hypothetical protein